MSSTDRIVHFTLRKKQFRVMKTFKFNKSNGAHDHHLAVHCAYVYHILISSREIFRTFHQSGRTEVIVSLPENILCWPQRKKNDAISNPVSASLRWGFAHLRLCSRLVVSESLVGCNKKRLKNNRVHLAIPQALSFLQTAHHCNESCRVQRRSLKGSF